MNSPFHVRSRVFGGRRARPAAPRESEPTAAPVSTDPLTPAPAWRPETPAHPLTRGTDPVTIDTMTWDQPEKTAAYLVPGRHNLLIDAGSARSAANVVRALEELDVGRIDYIALTHIHPDQAGGTGILTRRFPEATVLVHEDGANHVADPSLLLKAMRSMGGEPTVELFGEPTAVDPDRIRSVADGDSIDLGDRRIEAIATPGHTAAHLAWFDRRTGALFCGDALGVKVPGSRVVRPTTPPSDFCHRQALESIDSVRQSGADRAYRSHFGPATGDLDQSCNRAAETLERWHDSYLAKCEIAEDAEDLTRRFNASLEASLEPVGPAVRRSLELISPTWLNLAGMSEDRARPARYPDAA